MFIVIIFLIRYVMCVWVIYCSVSVSRRVKLLQLFATYKTTVIDSHTQTDVETQYICIRQQQQGYVCRAIALLQYKQRVCSIALTASSRMRRRASCCQQTYPAGLPTHQCQCIQQCATPPSPPYVPPGLLATHHGAMPPAVKLFYHKLCLYQASGLPHHAVKLLSTQSACQLFCQPPFWKLNL